MKFNKTAMLGTATVLASTLLGAGTAFAAGTDYAANPEETETPVQTKLFLPANGGTNPDPEKPTQPGDTDNPETNKPNNPDGPFGIAYQPNIWETSEFDNKGLELKESGEQSFQFTNTDSRVGVKDKTRQDKPWSLTAKLQWDGKQLPGATITTANADGKVQVNKGSQQYEDTDKAEGTANLEINNDAKEVMKGKNVQHNATYDYKLTDASLKIADAGAVEEGTYKGHVTWNLAQTI